MAIKEKDGDTLVSVNAKWVSYAHTIVAYTAFIGALIVGMSLHYEKIVQNQYYGYPQEWFPSVSSTIGDRYPERSVFMIFIAITSGPRFMLVFLWYLLTARSNSSLPKFIAFVGLFRTITCGGWTYITSTDDHDWHDIFMISYLVATIPWTVGCLVLSPNNPQALRYRKIAAACFFGTIVPLVYWFIQHKVHQVAGAYTIYSFFEWALVLFDVAFDAITALDFKSFELVVKDIKGASRGDHKLLVDDIREKKADQSFGQALNQPFSWNDALDAAADSYCGFIFWSILTSLGLTIWYFPLWYMGISGFEVFVLSTITPFFLGAGPLRSLVIRKVRTVHLLSLTAVAAYVMQRPVPRLIAVGFGTGMACLAWAATFYAERGQPARLENRALAFGVGLIASSIAKFAFYSNNPIWPIMHGPNGGWNKTGLALAVLAVLRSTCKVDSGSNQPQERAHGSALLAALGVGGLMFGTHSLLSDSSTMTLWVWDGFPVRGPVTAQGVLTITAMIAGLASGVYHKEHVSVRTKFAATAIGITFVTAFHGWLGYLGGLSFAFSIMSLSPAIIMSASRYNPAISFGFGFLVYTFMMLFHVWVVAYAFVPGGPLVRERTDWIQMTLVLLIGAGVVNLPGISKSGKSKGKSKAYIRQKASHFGFIIGILQLLAISIAYLRFPTNDYIPYHKDEKLITAGIWTIHFYLDNDMWSSERRMRDVIKELELDVVGLLESDNQRIIMGNRDPSQFLAEDLGMYVDYGPGPNKHTWGAALLSKFPIVNSTHHLLPSPVGELAPAIHATINAYGELVDVFVFHSGQDEDPEDRRLQSEYLAKLMKETPRPAILLSYLVTQPLKGNYHTYVGEKSGMRDIDFTDWDRWCEYILYKGLRRTGYARVSRSTITDTEIQVGKFVVGEPEGTDQHVPEDQIQPGLRFPALFRGEGVRGHAYHVFNEPRYFA